MMMDFCSRPEPDIISNVAVAQRPSIKKVLGVWGSIAVELGTQRSCSPIRNEKVRLAFSISLVSDEFGVTPSVRGAMQNSAEAIIKAASRAEVSSRIMALVVVLYMC